MKHSLGLIGVTMACFCLGCATAYKINKVEVGMTKDEVIAAVGKPVSISATAGTEYLNYRFSETDDHAFCGITTPYYVRLVNGVVDSYGRLGDFDSTKSPKIEIKREDIISADVTTSEGSSDMYTELMKLKQLKEERIISEEEFQREKKEILEKY